MWGRHTRTQACSLEERSTASVQVRTPRAIGEGRVPVRPTVDRPIDIA